MENQTRTFRIVNLVMLVVYLMSVAVQYNDPDPLIWTLIYGLAAFSCYLAHTNRLKWWMSAQIAGISLIWGAILTPKFFGKVGFFDLFESFTMKTIMVEYAREMGGLMIIAAWMIVLTIRTYPRKSANPAL